MAEATTCHSHHFAITIFIPVTRFGLLFKVCLKGYFGFIRHYRLINNVFHMPVFAKKIKYNLKLQYHCRLLLTKAMKTTQSPDDFGTVNTHYLPFGMHLLNNL